MAPQPKYQDWVYRCMAESVVQFMAKGAREPDMAALCEDNWPFVKPIVDSLRHPVRRTVNPVALNRHRRLPL